MNSLIIIFHPIGFQAFIHLHVGSLHFAGPGPQLLKQECTAGTSCAIRMYGINLIASSSLAIVSVNTYNSSSLYPDVGQANVDTRNPLVSFDGPLQFHWGVIDRFTQHEYLICWRPRNDYSFSIMEGKLLSRCSDRTDRLEE